MFRSVKLYNSIDILTKTIRIWKKTVLSLLIIFQPIYAVFLVEIWIKLCRSKDNLCPCSPSFRDVNHQEIASVGWKDQGV